MYRHFLFWFFLVLTEAVKDDVKFPDNFLFGTATSSYQIEGAWNEGGKGESIWDRMCHNNSKSVAHQHNADVAANSYYLYERDIEMLQELGVDFYRFSFSWPRILPMGEANEINEEGLTYYNNLINGLLKKNITPMATLYHWDLPQVLEDKGGFLNNSFPQWFEDYSQVIFNNFADRVKIWITFNEPDEICVDGYGSNLRAPQRNLHGYGEYICTANLLIAHAKSYRLYNETYKPLYGGKVGIAYGMQWAEGLTDSEEDKQSAIDALEFHIGYFAHPIFSKEGGFPKSVVNRVPKDRLIEIPIKYIKNTADFIGVNHYDFIYTTRATKYENRILPSFNEDLGIDVVYLRRWSKQWIKFGVSAFGKLLNWIKESYDNPVIYITENGMPGGPGLDDTHRAWFFRRYLAETLLAIKNGINVQAYTAWSLMDNFEWYRGYKERYGLYQVDYDHPNKTRTPKRSSIVYKNIVQSRTIDPDYMNDQDWNPGPKMEYLSQYRFKPTFTKKPTMKKAIEMNQGKNVSAVENIITALNLQILTFNKQFDYSNTG